MTQDREGTKLKISHGFSQTVAADCLLQRYDGDGFQRTTLLPIQPGLKGYEAWDNKVCQLLLRNVRFIKQSDKGA